MASTNSTITDDVLDIVAEFIVSKGFKPTTSATLKMFVMQNSVTIKDARFQEICNEYNAQASYEDTLELEVYIMRLINSDSEVSQCKYDAMRAIERQNQNIAV